MLSRFGMKRRNVQEQFIPQITKSKVGNSTSNNYSRSNLTSHRTWGLVLLSLLLCFYLTDFYNIVSARAEDSSLTIIPVTKSSVQSPAPFLLQYTNSEKVFELPGAIANDKRKFDDEGSKQIERNYNLLPGAIGITGHFDEHGDTTVEKSKTEETSVEDSEKSSGKGETAPEKKNIVRTAKKDTNTAEDKVVEGSAADTIPSTTRKRKLKAKKRKKRRLKSGELEKEDSTARSKKTSSRSRIRTLSPIVSVGPHPMNRDMKDLQVDKTNEKLNRAEVRSHYRRLVQKYLAPFSNGIPRSAFFDILKRRTYSLSPPGSNKGTQTVLFQLMNKKVFLLDPYEMSKHSKSFYQTRMKELTWLLSEVLQEEDIPNVEFTLAIHDCVQTVNHNHTYRGATFIESSPTFTIVACNFSDNIPFPMWEGDTVRGGLQSWDEKMATYQKSDTTPWEKKISRAVFRGGNRPSMYFKRKKDANEHCDEVGRTKLAHLGEKYSEMFDVSVGGTCGEHRRVMKHLSEEGHHSYKYILYAEGNCFWADRLNKQVFGPSAILKQETPCGQFWEPLMKPMTHYIPTDFFFEDAVEKLEWAKDHDAEVQKIVQNANNFAASFLSKDGIKTYVKVLLLEYAKLLKNKNFPREKGSIDVTVNTG